MFTSDEVLEQSHSQIILGMRLLLELTAAKMAHMAICAFCSSKLRPKSPMINCVQVEATKNNYQPTIERLQVTSQS